MFWKYKLNLVKTEIFMYEHVTKKKCGVLGSHWQDLNLWPPRCGLALLPTELETPVVAYAIYHHLVQLGSYVTCAPHIARISNVESIMFVINERWRILSLLNRQILVAWGTRAPFEHSPDKTCHKCCNSFKAYFIFIFISWLYFSGMMTKAEHSVHNEWFEWITKRQQPHLDLISKSF